MSFNISWEIEGEKQLSRRLLTIAGSVKNMQPAFEKSAKELVKEYSNDVFDTRGGAIDERWKRLSPATVARKARQGFSSQTLVATGAMKRLFDYRAGKDYAVIFNNADYFKYHQSNKPRRRLPRRVMMKLAERQRQKVVRRFLEHISKAMYE